MEKFYNLVTVIPFNLKFLYFLVFSFGLVCFNYPFCMCLMYILRVFTVCFALD